MGKRRVITFALTMATFFPAIAAEVAIQFQSTAPQTALLELYTSEGCSSCPPAEQWLSRLTDSPRLWREFVPVSFHVDYWDDLGWRDPWGKAEFSQRQRNYGAAWHSRTIYTPEFVLNGKEWRRRSGADVPKSSSLNAGIIQVSSADTNNWAVRFTPMPGGPTNYQAHVVWLVSGVKSDVKAGENAGRTLKHDFVVLSHTEAAMKFQPDGAESSLNLPMPTAVGPGRLAVAVWITEPRRLEPIQATGGWVTRP